MRDKDLGVKDETVGVVAISFDEAMRRFHEGAAFHPSGTGGGGGGSPSLGESLLGGGASTSQSGKTAGATARTTNQTSWHHLYALGKDARRPSAAATPAWSRRATRP